jgi:hypothetical protein
LSTRQATNHQPAVRVAACSESFSFAENCRPPRILKPRLSARRVSVQTPTSWLGRWNAEHQFVSDCSLSRRHAKHDIRSFRLTTFCSTRVNLCRAALEIVTRLGVPSFEEHRDVLIYAIASAGGPALVYKGVERNRMGGSCLDGSRLANVEYCNSQAEVLDLGVPVCEMSCGFDGRTCKRLAKKPVPSNWEVLRLITIATSLLR